MQVTLISILAVAIAELVTAINTGVTTSNINLNGDFPSYIRNGLLVAVYLFIVPAIPIASIVLIRSFDNFNFNSQQSTFNSNSLNPSTNVSPTSPRFPKFDSSRNN